MSEEVLSLYFDLEKGTRADFEAAAKAALAFADMVKEITVFIDPFLDARLELLDAKEGSLYFNGLLRGKSTRAAIKSVVVTAAIWLGGHALDFVWDKTTEAIWGKVAAEHHLTEDDLKQIKAIVEQTMKGRAGEKPAKTLFKEISKDPVVIAVGVSPDGQRRPAAVTKRDDFLLRAGIQVPDSPRGKRRLRQETVTVVLVSPVLLEGNRRWRFRSKDGEFGASIKDIHFIESLLSGQIPLNMKRDIEMTVDIDILEEFREGTWVPIKRDVVRIVGVPRMGPEQQLLFSD